MLNIEKLNYAVKQVAAKNPIYFELDREFPSESPFNFSNIEMTLGATLPDDYKEFVVLYGGGYFGLTVIYSVVTGGEWDICQANIDDKVEGYIIFSDNGCGDLYCFKIHDGVCGAEVYFFDHESEQVEQTNYPNIFSYLLDNAFPD